MKKRLSLLLAAVLAMAMITGMSIMAYAAESAPVMIDCGTDGHKCYEHFLVDTTVTYQPTPDDPGAPYVSGWDLQYNDQGTLVVTDYRQGNSGNYYMPRGNFPEHFETGWYYKPQGSDCFSKCPPPVLEAEPSSPAHTHDYHWTTIAEPTKDQDGIGYEECVCGARRNVQTISAFGFTLTEYATPMVVNAKPGETVEIDFGRWNSFPKSFMEKVAVKTQQNVSFGFHYNWNHVGQEIRIPAGTKIDTNFDWYGPAKMAELYGANQ